MDSKLREMRDKIWATRTSVLFSVLNFQAFWIDPEYPPVVLFYSRKFRLNSKRRNAWRASMERAVIYWDVAYLKETLLSGCRPMMYANWSANSVAGSGRVSESVLRSHIDLSVLFSLGRPVYGQDLWNWWQNQLFRVVENHYEGKTGATWLLLFAIQPYNGTKRNRFTRNTHHLRWQDPLPC